MQQSLTHVHNRDNISSRENIVLALQAAEVGTWSMQFGKPWRVECDEQCKKLFGYEEKNIVSVSEAFSYIDDDDLVNVIAAAKKALRSVSDRSFDVTFQKKPAGHNPCWVRLIGKVYFDDSAKPAFFAGIAMNVTSDVLARQEVATTDNLTQAALKGTGVGLFHINLETDEIEYSPALAIILTGENNTRLIRKDFINHLHPEDLQKRTNAYQASETSGEVFYEIRTIWNDGSIHWIRTVGSYTYSPTGKPLVFSGTMQDITTQKQREADLKEAEDKHSLAIRLREAMFRNVTSTSPTGLWMSDEEGKLIYLNQTLIDWTGLPYETLLGHGWADTVIEEDRPHTGEAFLTAIANRNHYEAEFRIYKGSDSVIWCRAKGDPYYNEDGSYAGLVGFCMDIQEQVDSINNLKVSEERLKALIIQAPVAIGLLNGREMIVQTANKTILKIWGKTEAIIGMKLQDALPELKGQPFMALLEKVYETGESHYDYSTLALLEHNGKLESVYFDFVYAPINGGNGAITGVMVIATDVTAQVTARRKVEESEARFKALIKESLVPTVLFSGINMKIEVINAAMLQVWGRDESVIGKTLLEAVPELEGQPFLELMRKVFTTGEPYHQNNARADLMIDGNLTTSYFNYNYKALKNEQGEIYAILNMAMNVTEQVLATQKLEESEFFARSILFNSPVAQIVFTGEDMIVNTVNQIMLSMLGRDDTITGKPFMEVMPELVETPLLERMRKVLHTGETYYQPEEKIVLIKDGKPYTGYYNYTYKSLANTSGELYGLMVTATEVTDQVTARQKIEEAEESLRGAVELAELSTWQINLTTGVRYFSERMRNWAGIQEDEVIDVNKSLSVIAEKDHGHIKASMAKALDPNQRSTYEAEYTLINQLTGKERIIHAQGKAFFNSQNQPYQIIGTAQDVTKQRKIQLALEQEVQQRTEEIQVVNQKLQSINERLFESNELLVRSNKELEQYAYVASHDLQEPLRKIRMYSSLLNTQPMSPDETKQTLEKIIQSSKRMTLLIQDLLEFSRLSHTDIIKKPVDLSVICKAVEEDFELSIQEKKAIVTIGSLPVIEAVELHMNQLIHNLLSNALKFSCNDTVPEIKITSRQLTNTETEKYIARPQRDSKYYDITVADNGIGFDMKYSEQIFEVFKRLHANQKYAGSGIGLALCRRIVINHKGHMFADSLPGHGTVFHIILPDKFIL